MKTKDELLNININKNANKYFAPLKKYFTYGDLLKLQEYISNMYSNFNGGFGMYSSNMVDTIIDEPIIFSFVIDDEIRNDICIRKNREKNDLQYSKKFPFEFNKNYCVEKITWLELILRLCELKNIKFKYDPIIIDEIIKT